MPLSLLFPIVSCSYVISSICGDKFMIDLGEIRRIRYSGQYLLRQLGTSEKIVLSIDGLLSRHKRGWDIRDLFEVVLMRTQYLNSVIPCGESEKACALAKPYIHPKTDELPRKSVITLDEGHIYQTVDANNNPITDEIKFVKRSGKAITYTEEWAGLQTQEVLRAMIDFYTLYKVHLPANVCRQILWNYEARAYRRKRQQLNREAPDHTPIIFPYGWEEIETMDIGDDGHIPYLESEVLYYANFGACDSEPIPGVDPFQLEDDPVYAKAAENLKIMGRTRSS